MFERFCMMQNLRALMQSELPAEVLDLQTRFLNVFGPDYVGVALNDLWSAEGDDVQYPNMHKRKSLDKETWGLLKRWFADNGGENHARQTVLFQRSVKRWNMKYSAHAGRIHVGDSNVVWGDLQTDGWHAGRIKSIFVWPGNTPQVFLVIDELTTLANTKRNKHLWQRYKSFAAGRIFEEKVSHRRVLRLDEVGCHSAVTPFTFSNRPCLHILPLERVSTSLLLLSRRG